MSDWVSRLYPFTTNHDHFKDVLRDTCIKNNAPIDVICVRPPNAYSHPQTWKKETKLKHCCCCKRV